MTEAIIRICDVEHGACAFVMPRNDGVLGSLAMVDVGDASDFNPTAFIRQNLGRSQVEYLFITNADQDHISDLSGVLESGIGIRTFTRNPTLTSPELRRMKVAGGGLTADMESYLRLHEGYTHPVTEPFDTHMGGMVARTYYNSFGAFRDTNNLSLVAVFELHGFRIMFPGDLEKDGWLALLEREDFRRELSGLTVLVASHHGRESGYCEEMFRYCHPKAIVMSDKGIEYSTQNTVQLYRGHVIAHHPSGVVVATTGKQRRVLTTRRDGHIEFVIGAGGFSIHTEYSG